jgi:hypothetical protein
MTKTLAILLLVCGAAMATESKYILATKRISSTDIAITCSNSGDPTGHKIGDVLIISCGQ